MPQAEQPQIYLVTPGQFELGAFRDTLGRVLDEVEVACIRIALTSQIEDDVTRACDLVREVAHARDIPAVVADHSALVERLGLDGVHLGDGARNLRKVRKTLGADPIIGAFCGASRHDGLNAGESGADYVAFGPLQASGLGHAEPASPDLFQWWSEMIEVPVVAEGALDQDIVRQLAPHTDFFAIGDEIWANENPAAALKGYVEAMR